MLTWAMQRLRQTREERQGRAVRRDQNVLCGTINKGNNTCKKALVTGKKKKIFKMKERIVSGAGKEREEK